MKFHGKNFGSHNITILNPNLCYKEMHYKETVLYMIRPIIKWSCPFYLPINGKITALAMKYKREEKYKFIAMFHRQPSKCQLLKVAWCKNGSPLHSRLYMYTVCLDKNNIQRKKFNYIWKYSNLWPLNIYNGPVVDPEGRGERGKISKN